MADGTSGRPPPGARPRLPRHRHLGLPPLATVEAGHRALDEWADGRASGGCGTTPRTPRGDRSPRSSARRRAPVAIGPAASTFLGLVAASLPDTAEVVVAEEDFTALLFPFLAQASRGVTVRPVPLVALADAVTDADDDGRVECGAVVRWPDRRHRRGTRGRRRAGALTVVDATQALPWLRLPLDRIDATVCSAYKWLCCPRGTAFMVVSPALLSMCRPSGASWFAAPDIYGAFYGPPLRLAEDARRFDLSPAWHAWVGAVASLDVLGRIGIDAIHDHDVRLADGLRQRLGISPTGSAIVSIAGLGAGIEEQVVGLRHQGRGTGRRLPLVLPHLQRR